MKRSVTDYPLTGKRVLVRVDFNVPLDEGVVADDTRIEAALPTIRYLIDEGCPVILASHLGRPDGKVVEELRMAPVAERLSELLGSRVTTVGDCVGPEAQAAAAALAPGEVLLLENLRFHPEETANDDGFATQLAGLAEVYVNDAFGTAHRAHASTEGVTRHLPSVAGMLMIREIDVLGRLLRNPRRPFVVVLGGLKVSDKIALIKHLLGIADQILVGGAMANAFFAAEGLEIGRSKGNGAQTAVAAEILAAAAGASCELVLPTDVVVAGEAKAGTPFRVTAVDGIAADEMALDIGPQTVREFVRRLRAAGTVYWNGPMGLFEIDDFSAGTSEVGAAIAGGSAVTVAGGGDTVAALGAFGLEESLTHVSTGGGASIEFLEGRTLPGVQALMDLEEGASMKRRPLIAGNWKMFKTRPEAAEYIRRFAPLVRDADDRDVLVCPPFTALETALGEAAGTNVAVGAQTMAASDEGAFTGEVSPAMLCELGVRYVILGHSERRPLASDTDEALALKVRAALDKGLLPILCCGESEDEHERGLTQEVLRRQVDADLVAVATAELPLLTVAYEPIWAIGTGKTATPVTAQSAIAYIRSRLRERFGDAAEAARILYGGSVGAANIDAIMAQQDIDGVLVGGASLDPEVFARVVRFQESE